MPSVGVTLRDCAGRRDGGACRGVCSVALAACVVTVGGGQCAGWEGPPCGAAREAAVPHWAGKDSLVGVHLRKVFSFICFSTGACNASLRYCAAKEPYAPPYPTSQPPLAPS